MTETEKISKKSLYQAIWIFRKIKWQKSGGIWAEQLKNEGKPEDIVAKIMVGKERKFREENALLTQAFVKDSEKTIEQLVKSAGAVVEKFMRFGI